MLPLLRLAADGEEHKVADAMETLALQMGISEADQALLLPSGVQTRLYNRVTWAVTDLTKSLLLERIGRGRFKITPRGLEVLAGHPERVDNRFLDQFAEYREFKTKRAEKAVATKREDDGSLSDDPATGSGARFWT